MSWYYMPEHDAMSCGAGIKFADPFWIDEDFLTLSRRVNLYRRGMPEIKARSVVNLLMMIEKLVYVNDI